jgi:hypothetical protein
MRILKPMRLSHLPRVALRENLFSGDFREWKNC